MLYASVEIDGSPIAGEVIGELLVPLKGKGALGGQTSIGDLIEAERLHEEAVPFSSVRIRPVVPEPAKVFCVGLNFHSHITETGRDLPSYPVLFPKWASSLIGAEDAIVLPPESSQVDYEGELVAVIGKAGRRIREEDALSHVLGYAVANDVTMRDYQYKTHQWLQGKAWDASTPIGPTLVTPDEVDLGTAHIRTVLNGRTVQDSYLSKLIFPVPRLIAIISEFTQLVPGDLIFTGTPSGVGYRQDPQVFLTDGDVVSVIIDGVGELTSHVTKS